MLKSNSLSNYSLSLSSSFQSLQDNKLNNNIQSKNSLSSQIYCSKCHTLSLSSITIKKQKEGKKYNINITCENNHKEEKPLSNFALMKGNLIRKECAKCNKNIVITKISYCYKCQKYYCSNCLCEHKEENKNAITSYFGLLENKCSLHNNKIKDFYCLECTKYFCKICIKNHSQHKKIINLMDKFCFYQNLLKTEISKEKNLAGKYNEMLNSMRKMIQENIQYKKYMLDIKKSILNSYNNNNKNYFNIQNIEFAKNLSNNEKYKQNNIKKLYEKLQKYYKFNH